MHNKMEKTVAKRRQMGDFNEQLSCRICLGYMIDPTTVDYCYHTYCRSCILKHLLRDVYCPQCKGNGGKQISEDNLRSDDILRALIYKMVPGLYQRESERLVEFEEQHKDLDADDVLKPDKEQEFFTPTEPISLSLEYHPAMLKHCRASDKPPVCYLQCPAGLRIAHLKQFLCSKYDIDAHNKQVEVEVTYEDEVLQPSLTLMDVGYCYHWMRHAPMSFQYRILLYEDESLKNDENSLSKVNQDVELRPALAATKSAKSVTFADELETRPHATPTSKTRAKSNVKVNSKSHKRITQSQSVQDAQDEAAAQAVSNFKSLRSNDMRYSHYVAAPAPTPTPTPSPASAPAPLLRVKSEPEQEQEQSSPTVVSNMNIVVSIPQSQLSKSAAGYADEGGFELKTANKKSSSTSLPKLKIELNSMKAKLSLPKSADARLEDVSQQLDLETYAKNIGLKPIEPAATPNASPMSSCSSSTNGSNGTAEASNTTATTSSSSSSSHRKRKKKHSKEPKDANGKRKKLHAEISSQTDGKMKMKITTTHNHKAHKLDLKRSHSLAGGELATQKANDLNRTLGEEARSISSLMTTASASTSTSAEKLAEKMPQLPASPPLPPSLFKSFAPASGIAAATSAVTAAAATTVATTAAATVATSKVATTAATSANTTAAVTTAAKPKLAVAAPPKHLKPSTPPANNNNNNKRQPTLTPLPAAAAAAAHFAVPQAPLRQTSHQMLRYLSTPSSIASAANKQPKRSMSLDESAATPLAKHPRLEYQQQVGAKYAAQAAAKLKASATQLRLYGPEMSNNNKPATMPLLSSLNLPPTSLGSGSVTITPRPRNTQARVGVGSGAAAAAGRAAAATVGPRATTLNYPYGESALSNLPALEIVRLGLGAAAAATAAGRLMGPPASLPKQPAKRGQMMPLPLQLPLPLPLPLPMPMSMSLSAMPTSVKSPPLSVALSAQRGNHNNSHNAAYRTSPPALINLRNTVPVSFPSKSATAAAKVELNSKKSAAVAAATAAAATATGSKANGAALLDSAKSLKTSLRDFRPPTTTTATTAATAQATGTTTAATTTTATTTTAAATTATAKDADILDLSAQGTGRSSKLAPTSPPVANNNSNSNNNSSSSNSLEAALNKIKQNISANSNNSNCSNVAAAAAVAAAVAAAAASGAVAGDDLQNLHMLSESATAREKISIKAGNSTTNNLNNNSSSTNSNNTSSNSSANSSNIYENKPKNAVVRPQNASVRSIPNPSALAFRNQATLLTSSNSNNSNTTSSAAAATVTTTATTAVAAAVKQPLTVKADEKPKLSTATMLLSPNSNNNNNNNNSSSNNNNNCNAATSPRATKKATTIDQVAANLNIRAEAKAAALAEEAPPTAASVASAAVAVAAAKSPESEKTATKSDAKEATVTATAATTTTTAAAAATVATTTAAAATVAATTTAALPMPLATATVTTTATVTATATATATATVAASSISSESLSKPPVQISATDTPVPVASSA